MRENCVLPFEDELAIGILGRFGRLNGCSSIRETQTAVRKFSAMERASPFILVFANAIEIEYLEFSERHSMQPSMRPVIDKLLENGKEKSWLGGARKTGMVVPSGRMRWCRQCLDVDRRKMGISYWKRSHHLSGVDWCLKHHCQLTESPLELAISPPGGAALGMTTPDVLSECLAPSITRVAEIMTSWLIDASPISLDAWAKVVRDRCQEMGIRLAEIGRRLTVSDLIKDNFPASWLSRYMPEVLGKSATECIRKVDGACFDKHVVYPALTCAAILAVLFESAESALMQLRLINDSIAKRIQPSASDLAYRSFLEGLSLDSACLRFGADIIEVEALLRSAAKNLG